MERLTLDFGLTLDLQSIWEILRIFKVLNYKYIEIIRGPHLLRLRLRFRRFRLPRTGNSSPSKKQNTTAKHHYNHYWLQSWSQNCINIGAQSLLCKGAMQTMSTSFHRMLWHLARSGTAWQGLLKSRASHHRCDLAMWSSSLAALALQFPVEYVSHTGHTEPQMRLRCHYHGCHMDHRDKYGYGYSRHSSDSYSML